MLLFYQAINYGKLDVVKVILDAKCQIDHRVPPKGDMDKTSRFWLEGESGLHIAARNGNLEIVKLLFNRGMKLNWVTVTKTPPLHYAVLNITLTKTQNNTF